MIFMWQRAKSNTPYSYSSTVPPLMHPLRKDFWLEGIYCFFFIISTSAPQSCDYYTFLFYFYVYILLGNVYFHRFIGPEPVQITIIPKVKESELCIFYIRWQASVYFTLPAFMIIESMQRIKPRSKGASQ